MRSINFILATHAKDEEGNFSRFVKSEFDQSQIPGKWAIVNYGGTDLNKEIGRFTRNHFRTTGDLNGRWRIT